ncbi:hypothetical protein GCM10020001_024730 [Nonomuraea salmonea]
MPIGPGKKEWRPPRTNGNSAMNIHSHPQKKAAHTITPQYGKDNFSVQAVLGTHNSTAGGDLAVFYARYRVLLGNKFWVAVQ